MKEKLKSRTWRMNNLYRITDDHGRDMKFEMNAIQHILFRALWWLNIILKSRQHGITTFVCIFFLDACLFTPNVRAGIIAHKLIDAKKIFRDKIKYAYNHLPPQIKAMRPLLKDDSMELIFGNNSGIYAGTTMHSATLQYLLVTEYGWLCAHAPQRARDIKNAMETVHEHGFVIVESTAEDVGDDFQAMCSTAQDKRDKGLKLTRMDYRFHFLPWYLKPQNVLHEHVDITDEHQSYLDKIEMETGAQIAEPQRAWYVKKKEVLKEKMYSQHPSTPEEAFFASSEGSFYGRYMVRAQEAGRIGRIPWEKSAPVHCMWDLGDMHTSIWFWQLIGEWIHCIDHFYDNEGLGLDEYAKMLQTKPYLYGEHFCGPDMVSSNRKKNGVIIIDAAASLGIHFRPVEPHSIADRHESTRLILNKCKFDKARCEFGIRGMIKYRKEKNELASTEDVAVYRETPLHDYASHIADAFGHGAVAYRTVEIGGTIMGMRAKRPATHVSEVDMGVTDLIEA